MQKASRLPTRCFASPTTSTEADTMNVVMSPSHPMTAFATPSSTPPDVVPRSGATPSLSKGEPNALAAAVLFREILKPLANGLGPVGEIALGAVADELFVRRPR